MKKSCIFVLGTLLSCCCFAQNLEGVSMGTSFSSDNSKEVDESKVTQIFGQPNRSRRGTGEDGDIGYTYFYGSTEKSDCLAFSDGLLVFYGLRTPRFLAASDLFNGGIRVGDSISKVINAATYWENYQHSPDTNPEKLLYSYGSQESSGQTSTFIRVFRANDDSFLMIKYSGNTITYIEFDYNR